MRNFVRFSALGAFFVLAITALAACGGGASIPGNSVAKVGDTPVTMVDFNHWMGVANASSQQQSGATAAVVTAVPVPPDYTACIADKKKTAAKPAKGQPAQTDAQFKTQCAQQYASLKDQVMQFLINSDWITSEASDQGVKVSAAEVTKEYNSTKKQSFPKDSDYKAFLKSSGMTDADVKYRVRLDALSNALRAKVTKGKGTATPAAISAYYNKNKAKFAQPERRDLRIVLTKTSAQASAAKKALQSGQSWKTVAKKDSIDQASKNQGGVLLAVSKGQQEQALDTAVFAAAKDKLTGPVKTQFGYYIFTVSKITPASQQTLAQATPTIKQLLVSQNQQKALNAFVTDFTKKWTGKTNCRKGYITTSCKNAPKTKTTTAGATTPAPTATTG